MHLAQPHALHPGRPGNRARVPAPRALVRPRPCLAPALLALLVTVVALAAPADADAEAERVVLAGVPDNLADATHTVLVPWQIEIVRTPQTLTADPDQARRDAGAVAERARAGAVVWLAPAAPGFTLWVYDTSSRQVHSRPLATAPPFDEPTAASVALSIKTMLRHSSVAPPAERIAPPAPAPAVGHEPGPEPGSDLGTDRPLKVFEILARASLRLSVPAPDPDEPGIEPRLGLGAAWWPAFASGYGASIEVELGPGLSVSKSGLRGELEDVSASLAVHRRIASSAWPDGRVAFVPALGLGLHVVHLTGDLQSGRGSADITYVLPSADAGIDVRVRLGRVFQIGAGLRASLMLRTHDFEVDMRPVSTSPAFQMTSGITVSASL